MTFSRRRFLHLATAAAVFAPRIVSAQAYPARAVRVIVPYAPAGPTDVFARLMAQKLSEHLGAQFYVENIAGAGGNIGIGRAAQTTADGYTILVTGANIVVNPALYPHVPFDPAKDFAPITLAVTAPAVLTVNPALPVQTVKDLVALIKANPGKYSFASPGTGTPPHLVGELFRLSIGLDLIHVPFNGGGPAIGSAVAGHTPISFGSMAPAVPLVKDGKLRALAVSSKRRSPPLPDVPTMAEAGYPEVEGESWFAVVVPAGTPKEIIALLQREIARAIALPDMKERLAALGYEPVASTPEDCAAQFRTEIAKWGKVIGEAGIKAQ
ncbi:MAG TPA: tripartite tricarboxylate transporter substrate binding protein [Xanthobacteraceae bacterium]|jgi:tripartite-type tricarboxylate transporter receptor subunit TctC